MSELGEKTALAIDPGSSKCGLAIVQRDSTGKLKLIWRAIVPPEDLVESIEESGHKDDFSLIIVGSGTTSKVIVESLRLWRPSMAILIVDERDTTIQARERYWVHNPRRGLRKLLPATLQLPPEPFDDFAALILAERVLTA